MRIHSINEINPDKISLYAENTRLISVTCRISEYCPGYIDWSSKHTIIFSKLLRTLNLSVRYNKVTVGDGTGMGSESSGAEWIVWMLGGVNERFHLIL